MPIDLLKRGETAGPITAAQYDANITLIENLVNALQVTVAQAQAKIDGLTLAQLAGILNLAKGGTGSTTVTAARSSLGVPDRGASGNDIRAFWRGSQAAYNALGAYSSTTLYLIDD